MNDSGINRACLRPAHLLAWMVALLLSAGCGSSDGPPPPTHESPSGLWAGTLQQSGGPTLDVFGMSSPNGGTIFIPGLSPFLGSVLYWNSRLLADIETGDIDDTMSLIVSGLLAQTYQLQATYRPRSSFTGSLTLLPSMNNLDLQWDPLSDRTASLNKIAGVWSDLRGGTSRMLTITASGQLSGSDSSGCVYDGQLKVAESNTNVYDLTMDISACFNFTIHFNGLATLLDTSSTEDTFLFAVVGFTPLGFSEIGVLDRQ